MIEDIPTGNYIPEGDDIDLGAPDTGEWMFGLFIAGIISREDYLNYIKENINNLT